MACVASPSPSPSNLFWHFFQHLKAIAKVNSKLSVTLEIAHLVLISFPWEWHQVVAETLDSFIVSFCRIFSMVIRGNSEVTQVLRTEDSASERIIGAHVQLLFGALDSLRVSPSNYWLITPQKKLFVSLQITSWGRHEVCFILYY